MLLIMQCSHNPRRAMALTYRVLILMRGAPDEARGASSSHSMLVHFKPGTTAPAGALNGVWGDEIDRVWQYHVVNKYVGPLPQWDAGIGHYWYNPNGNVFCSQNRTSSDEALYNGQAHNVTAGTRNLQRRSRQWNLAFEARGRGGSYPCNCRGYVGYVAILCDPNVYGPGGAPAPCVESITEAAKLNTFVNTYRNT